MKRRIWPDIVIVIAVLALGAGGVLALWGDSLRTKGKGRAPAPVSAGTPMT